MNKLKEDLNEIACLVESYLEHENDYYKNAAMDDIFTKIDKLQNDMENHKEPKVTDWESPKSITDMPELEE